MPFWTGIKSKKKVKSMGKWQIQREILLIKLNTVTQITAK